MESGTKLGHYEILSLLGKGGMGEVWRARDTKLGREVAIKTLPEEFSKNADRLARFEREARLLASLNHPNIAAIHGFEEDNGTHFLVLELVEGDTLADRLKRGAIPVEESLKLALQIAEAVEAAHDKGVIHRDLKPANVKVTPDGNVKVLDFGLAKAFVDDQAKLDPSNAPTLTTRATQPGIIMGTPAYMSPEQARGEDVDKRTDIWALGCILYRMLTGRPPFDRDGVADTLSRVLQREPDWTLLPDVTPSLTRLLRLCLEKNPKKRRQAVGDVRIDLEQALTDPVTLSHDVEGRRSRRPTIVWVAGTVLLVALAISVAIQLREPPSPQMQLEVTTPSSPVSLQFALSPDGQYIVFVAGESAGDDTVHLYLRRLDDGEVRALDGTDEARYPFWSPDSRSIGFFASEQLLRIDIAGGLPVSLAPAPIGLGGAWNTDDTIVYAPESVSPLLKIRASGGEPVAATQLESAGQKNHRHPFFLPDGRRFLFFVEGDPGESGIYLGSLDGGVAERLTAASDSRPAYVEPGYILFVQEGALIARRLDVSRGQLTGEPLTLAQSTASVPSAAMGVSASTTGIVAYRRAEGDAQGRLTWFDDRGNVLEVGDDLNGLDLSPNERYVAYDRTIDGNRDVWVMDLLRGGSIPITTHPATDGYPVWSPDGQGLVFESVRNGTFDLFIGPSDRLSDRPTARTRNRRCLGRLPTRSRWTGPRMGSSFFTEALMRTMERRIFGLFP